MVHTGIPYQKGRLGCGRPESDKNDGQDNVCVSKGETESSRHLGRNMDEMEAREIYVRLNRILANEKMERTIISDLNEALENQNVIIYSFGEITRGKRMKDKQEFNQNYKPKILRLLEEHKQIMDKLTYQKRRLREMLLSGGFEWGLIEKRLRENIL
jgi:hypothetical protein